MKLTRLSLRMVFAVGLVCDVQAGVENPAITSARREIALKNYTSAGTILSRLAYEMERKLGHGLPPARLGDALSGARDPHPVPERFLERAQESLDASDWEGALFQLTAARGALAALDHALPVRQRQLRDAAAGDQLESPARLQAAAREALEAGDFLSAVDYSTRAITLIESKYKGGVAALMLHRAHTIRGIGYLSQNDIPRAITELIASVDGIDASAWPSGPNMALASRLLDANQSGSVLKYLDRCGGIGWANGKQKLAEWKSTIEAGKKPFFDAVSLLF